MAQTNIARDGRAVDHDELVEVPLHIPRSALTFVQSPPSHVSQKTSERELGIPRGVFLTLARDFDRARPGELISTGKLRIVPREPFLAWLRSRSSKPVEATPETRGLLDELGLRVLSGGRR